MSTPNARERAQSASAEMSLLLEGPSEKRYFDETAPIKALQDVIPVVEEMCAHLLADKKRELASVASEHRAKLLPPVNIRDGDVSRRAVTLDDFQSLLNPLKRAMGTLMLHHPRSDGELIDDYRKRLALTYSDGRWGYQFGHMSLWLAHIARIEDEERAAAQRQREREEQERQARVERQRAERKALEKQATVDEREVKRLLAVIEEAREAEELLALHNRAQRARGALREIYRKEREALVALGKPAPERSVPEAPFDDAFALGVAVGSSSKRSDALILPRPEALEKIAKSTKRITHG
jgi:hypothetical protein